MCNSWSPRNVSILSLTFETKFSSFSFFGSILMVFRKSSFQNRSFRQMPWRWSVINRACSVSLQGMPSIVHLLSSSWTQRTWGQHLTRKQIVFCGFFFTEHMQPLRSERHPEMGSVELNQNDGRRKGTQVENEITGLAFGNVLVISRRRLLIATLISSRPLGNPSIGLKISGCKTVDNLVCSKSK